MLAVIRGRMLRFLTVMAVIVGLCAVGAGQAGPLGPTGVARADGVEYLQVPSAAMGRDIPVAFLAGGPHAAILLDAFNAGPDVSNWVGAGNAMNTLAGKGISVAAPAGGAFSMYTNWEGDGSKQWETFLSAELPDWLAANKGLAPSGHALVGAAQGGTAAVTLAAFYPNRFRYAGSLSGFLDPSNTFVNGAIQEGMMRFGGADANQMWGPAQLGRWKWHDPTVHSMLLVQNNTRVWIWAPASMTASDPAAMIGYPDQSYGGNRTFYAQYRSNGGSNLHADFPAGGDNGWGSWAAQLGAMSGDIAAAIK